MSDSEPHRELPGPSRLQVLLNEYGKTQDSAEHHDTLIWTSTSIIWGGILLLLAYVITIIDAARLRGKLSITIAALVASFLALKIKQVAWIWNEVMNRKYYRCQLIESLLNMRQHRDEEQKYPKREMMKIYQRVTWVFIFVWAAVLAVLWGPELLWAFCLLYLAQ